ncbi:MAG: cytochrome b5 domain-containing protein [Candidatus Lernaella stagnicola]|nr:cytochrome b5 domain-containing protein [Candidatus Lernaella stagnicola]
MKGMTRSELAEFNGQDGKPTYVAYKSKIYDLSASKKWKSGKHMLKHDGGADLTKSMDAAPHGDDVFAEFPIVAHLVTEMTHAELAEHNGQDGKPTYVAYQGKIYDVSESKKWKNGQHMMKHAAGQDLTAAMGAAPHDAAVFENFPAVGALVEEEVVDEHVTMAPWPLSTIYKNFPFVKRHSHPFAVHFPIGLILAGFLFALLHLFFGQGPHYYFERTALHLVVLGTLTAPFAVLTGMQSWWLYYGLGKTFKLMFKLIGGIIVTVVGAIIILMHVANPTVLTGELNSISYLYIGLYGAEVLLVATVGYIGGQLTFPDH